MEDRQIVELYWARSEKALAETAVKYGRYCFAIAHNVLDSDADSEECVNDTYMNAWNSMPEERPDRLKAFLGRITRNLSLDKLRKRTADKRGGGRVETALAELRECVPSNDRTERVVDDLAITAALNGFLASLSAEKRRIFMLRYWYFASISEIASRQSVSESKVKTSLMRSRHELKRFLEKEGIEL